ncbi:hypothetical protein [Serratia fonticola]|uniref:hypothetical protein n=1 Tax=Serratia fonticola TaxID=47917 RepID=UPI0012696CCD|nr:hypothetical protein [Serratia fonticola]
MNKTSFVFPSLLMAAWFANAGEYFYISQGDRDIGHIELDMADDGFPCFDRQKLMEWEILSPTNMSEVPETGCIKVKDLYPLNITVTLIDKVNFLFFTFLESTEVKADPRLAIEYRDEGIPAILINYDVNYKNIMESVISEGKEKIT